MFTRTLAALLVAWLCSSCSQLDQGISIPFEPSWNGTSIGCDSVGTALTDLRFYVSNVQLIDSKGLAHDVRFATEMDWQNDAVALIDIENGAGACLNGTAETSNHVLGVAPEAQYKGLRFTIGVPFRLNHENPLAAQAPLDDPDMHWHWRSGYKFLRTGIRTDNDGFWIHLGSAACEGTVGNISDCRFPNRIAVDLPDFVPGQSTVDIDLAVLVSGVALDDGTTTDCSSGPPQTSCTAPFAALGLDFTTGKQSGTQRVFSVQ